MPIHQQANYTCSCGAVCLSQRIDHNFGIDAYIVGCVSEFCAERGKVQIVKPPTAYNVIATLTLYPDGNIGYTGFQRPGSNRA